MKAVFPLKTLQAACAAVASIVPSRTTKDILKNVKLSVTKDGCSISATDTEASIVHYMRGVECQRGGEILLPCDKLLQILREAWGESIVIDCNVSDDVDGAGVANITVGRSKFKIPTEDAGGFPPVVEFTETAFRTIKSSDMAKIVKRCSCTTNQSKRPALAGVNFEIKEKLTAIAANGGCMSVVECEYATEGTVPSLTTQTVVPPKAMKLVGGSLSGDGTVDFSVTDNSIKFRTGDVTISAQLISGRFPDWRRIVPSSCSDEIQIPVAQFAGAIRQSTITANIETRGVDFCFNNGTLTLKSSGKGSSEVQLPISFDGDVSVLIDPQFILSGITMLDKEASVTFGMNGPESVVLLTSDDGLRYVAMPLRRE